MTRRAAPPDPAELAHLKAEHKHLRALLSALPDICFVLDAEGRYLQVVGGADPTLFNNGKDLEGRTLHEALPDEVADRFLALVQRTLESEEIQTLEYPRHVPGDGAPGITERGPGGGPPLQWFEARVAPLPGYEHSLPCVLWMAVNITQRKRMEDELRRLATTDTLTGVSNRRYLLEQADNEIRRARRYGHHLTVLVLDVDNFKRVNDTYGHSVGDQVLRLIARACADNLRESDIFGRTGGEEFVAVLPETDPERARPLADRLRRAVADLDLPAALTGHPVTVSIGGAGLEEGDNVDTLIGRADRGLYAAKRNGRNRYRFQGPG